MRKWGIVISVFYAVIVLGTARAGRNDPCRRCKYHSGTVLFEGLT